MKIQKRNLQTSIKIKKKDKNNYVERTIKFDDNFRVVSCSESTGHKSMYKLHKYN